MSGSFFDFEYLDLGKILVTPHHDSSDTRRCHYPEDAEKSGYRLSVTKRPANKSIPYQIPSDTIEVRDSDNAIVINSVLANVERYEILVLDKVVRCFFYDGSFEKVVLQEGDTFNIDDAIRICIAKRVGRQYYNLKGIQNLSERLSYLKCIDKMIHKLHVKYRKAKKAEEVKAARAKKSTKTSDTNHQYTGPQDSDEASKTVSNNKSKNPKSVRAHVKKRKNSKS